MAVCSTPSSPLSPGVPGMVPLLKFLLTEGQEVHSGDRKYTQGTGSTLRRQEVHSGDRKYTQETGSTLRGQQALQHRAHRRPVDQLQHEQQQAVTVIWTVLRPGWQTGFRYSGLCDVLLSPRSMHRGVALTLTCRGRGAHVTY
ncbi:hypothetical protein EYF80_047854 [Liparis tanakae]|uniref:Uncharacterized protein n=1 Tax=Liparis tanakae TaxID=230148 RepID=A0A4Z2FL66_9TELE|nr:hypothetical protein EYF80_047854 [Liparis tanakae]